MKSVLITGGTGSFGNAFVRRLLNLPTPPQRIVVYSRDEQKQETMARALGVLGNHSGSESPIRFFIGDVRDLDRLELALRGITTVIHAAALKIVPTAEYNPTECIATNVDGAANVVKAAIRMDVKKVIALSTDKAVNPINLYGASKLAAEKIFVASNSLGGGQCAFSVVRYGNVVGSRGSVIPLFRELALDSKALPVTDPRMTRFWITMEQAIDLVMFAHGCMRGREIFVPKIPSMRIVDLVAHMTEKPPVIVGIRPGEKLHECLITEDEARTTYETDKYYIISPQSDLFYQRVADGFRYTSDTNEHWMTMEDLIDAEIIQRPDHKKGAIHPAKKQSAMEKNI